MVLCSNEAALLCVANAQHCLALCGYLPAVEHRSKSLEPFSVCRLHLANKIFGFLARVVRSSRTRYFQSDFPTMGIIILATGAHTKTQRTAVESEKIVFLRLLATSTHLSFGYGLQHTRNTRIPDTFGGETAHVERAARQRRHAVSGARWARARAYVLVRSLLTTTHSTARLYPGPAVLGAHTSCIA